jgi:hypothetical protein
MKEQTIDRWLRSNEVGVCHRNNLEEQLGFCSFAFLAIF